jgi:hypothetical protein
MPNYFWIISKIRSLDMKVAVFYKSVSDVRLLLNWIMKRIFRVFALAGMSNGHKKTPGISGGLIYQIIQPG